MKLCIISPVAGLEEFSSRSRTHLVLAHINNPDYMKFYKHRKQRGDFLILDNGAYEGEPFRSERHFRLIDYYEPDVVVLPDKPFKHGKITLSLSVKFLNQCIKKGYKCDFMSVPQSNIDKRDQWWKYAEKFLEISEIKWMGLSKLLKRTFTNHKCNDNRITLACELFRSDIKLTCKLARPDIKLHALGMWDGDIQEFKLCAKSAMFESLDTAAPVWRGWRGYTLGLDIWPDIPVDFSASKYEYKDEKLINHNLSLLTGLL